MADDKWQVSAAAVVELQNLTGCGQPSADFDLFETGTSVAEDVSSM